MEYDHMKIPVEVQPNCVVGIGASAGGLEALQQFLTFLPRDTGMAFVIIQHLSPAPGWRLSLSSICPRTIRAFFPRRVFDS